MPLSRSENMARIGARNTMPEVAFRKALWERGFRYRLHLRTPGGRADLVLANNVAVFIDGCFWHGCPEHYVRPRSSNMFWDKKLRENVERDRRQTAKLLDEGWRCIRLWEHAVREDTQRAVSDVARAVLGGERASFPRLRVIEVKFLDAEGRNERRFLEDLLTPGLSTIEEGPRVTRKTGRIQRTSVDQPIVRATTSKVSNRS